MFEIAYRQMTNNWHGSENGDFSATVTFTSCFIWVKQHTLSQSVSFLLLSFRTPLSVFQLL